MLERSNGMWLRTVDGTVIEGILHFSNDRMICLRTATVDDTTPHAELLVPAHRIKGVGVGGCDTSIPLGVRPQK